MSWDLKDLRAQSAQSVHPVRWEHPVSKVLEARLALLAAPGYLELRGYQARQACPAFLDRSVRREIEGKRASAVPKGLVG